MNIAIKREKTEKLKNSQSNRVSKIPVQHWCSLLFIPQYAYPKAHQIGADCYIADLQDSVPHNIKEAARQGIIDADQKGYFKDTNLIVRVNELAEELELYRDIETMVGLPSVLGFLVTMVETAEDMNRLHCLVATEEKKKGVPVGTYRFMVLIETPAAIFNALEIAKAGGGRNIGMLLGSDDLFRLSRAESTVKLTLDFPRNDVVLACRAAGIEPFDTPYTNITDKLGLEWSCHSGKVHGFTGKAAIHADHIKTIRRTFIPEPHKIEQAKVILNAQAGGELNILMKKTNWKNHDETRLTNGMGVLKGKLIGPPHIKDAMLVLAKAKALAPKARPGLRGIVAKHLVRGELKPGKIIPNPFEITITESMLGLWNVSFYSHDRTTTSQIYAQKLGLAPKGQLPVPFMMGMYLAVCMSNTHGVSYHLGFRGAKQLLPIYTGMTVRQNIIVKSVKPTSNKKNSVITTSRELIDVNTNKILFTVDKIELSPILSYDFSANGSFDKINEEYHHASALFKSSILSHCKDASLLPDKNNVKPMKKRDLILHTFARPMGVDSNLALSTLFKVTHPIHLDYHVYEASDTKGITVSGGLVESLVMAASSRDFHEVIWEELIQGDNLIPIGPRDTIGAISYIMDKKVHTGSPNYEELTVRTYGLKNISPATECLHLEFPPELFENGHKKPSEYEKILENAGAYWLEGKLATIVTRKIIRLIPEE